jgi:ABC-type sugar transport system substrate-binding protein
MDRRTAIRVAAGGLLAATAPAVLSACGRTVAAYVDRVGYQLDANLGEGATALSELVPLATARARELGMDPVLEQVAPGHMAALLGQQSMLGPYDPQTNTRPPVSRLVVVGAVEPGSLEPIAARAIARGVKIVPYPRALSHQTAAIVFDAPQAAVALARGAAEWARERLAGRGRALLVLPSSECASENALCSEVATIEQAWRATLAREAPGLEVETTDEALGALGGAATIAPLVRRNAIDVVLAWSDEVAAGVARALREHPPPDVRADGLYVAALGAPTVASSATFSELRQNGPLRLVIAARLRDLAYAMVELPHTLLHDGPAHDVGLAPWTLTPRSDALAAYSRDYASHPPHATITYERVSLNPSAFR